MKLANLSQWNNFSPILIPREISRSEGSMFDYFSIDPLPQMNLRSLPDKRVLLYFFFFSTKNQFYLLFLILWKFGLKIGLSNLNVQERLLTRIVILYLRMSEKQMTEKYLFVWWRITFKLGMYPQFINEKE